MPPQYGPKKNVPITAVVPPTPLTGDEKGVTNVEQEGMKAVDVEVHQTEVSEDNKCENKTEGMTSVGSDVREGILVMKLLHYVKRKIKSQS